MKRIILLLLVLFSFCFFVAGQSIDKSSEQGKSANCECLDSLFQIAKAHQFAGNTEEAVRCFTMIIDRCKVVDSCNLLFVSESYKNIEKQYVSTRQFDLLVSVAQKYLDVLDLAKESFENELINTLYRLSVFDRQNMDEAFAYGVRAEKMLSSAKENRDSDALYFEIVYNLAWNRFEVKDFVQSKVYYQKCYDYLMQNGGKGTKDCFFVLIRFFKCAHELGEHQLALELGRELEPLIFKYSDSPMKDACDYAEIMYKSCASEGKTEDASYYYDEFLSLKEQLPLEISEVDESNIDDETISNTEEEKQEADITDYDVLYSRLKRAFNEGDLALVCDLAEELEPLFFGSSEIPKTDVFEFIAYAGDACAKAGNYKKALHYYDEALSLLPQLYEGEQLFVSQAQVLVASAEVFNMLGNKQEAIRCIQAGREKLKGLYETTYIRTLNCQLYATEGQLAQDYYEAMACFDSALLINRKLMSEEISSLTLESNSNQISDLMYQQAIFLLNRGMVQYYNGATTEGYDSFETSSSILRRLQKQNSPEYLACQNNISVCQLNLGEYSDAIITLDGIMEIVKNNYGMLNYYYAACLQNYALYYQCNGQPDKALQYCIEAAIVNKSIFGEESEKYGQIVALIGHMYLANQMPNEAFQYLSEGLSIIDKNGGTSSYVYCHILSSLAIASFKLGHVEDGFKYYDKVEPIIDSIYGSVSQEHAHLALSMGWEALNYERGGDFAFDRLLDAAGTYLTIGQTYRPEYINSLIGYAVAGLAFDKPIAGDYIELATKAVASYYGRNVAYYSSTDRECVWETLSNIKNTIISTRTNDKSDIFIFNYLLFSKSLMLSTTDSFKKAVFNAGQQDLINQYNNIQAIQRSIDVQGFGIQNENQTPEQLYERKTSMERKLMAEMIALGYSVNDSVSYDDIRKTLHPNEIAIEFLDYYHLKDRKTYYVALLAKSSLENPVYVQLCTEDELKSCIGNPNVTYSTDDLYRLLWQPLAEYINEGDKVYFSPSGMLHTIALESLHTPDGSCLSDKYNLVRLTSTRELCKERQPKTYETGAIYGGLQYDVDQQRMTEVAAMNKTASEESPVFALRGEDRGNWNYLQGTKDEVEHIAGIMRQANIGCQLFEGDLGNEESFKALSGSNTDIIHLATHGYFIEGEKADMNDFMQSLSPLARQKTDSVIDPLLRSGLILSGGNRAWLGQEVPEGIEDGVLTALEISTMNLSGTDMVVMSACETGLGDITSDGVFGLQRAFKMAGVQTLVMSLWKVDDNATSLMMQTFYEHLLSGMSKREAFNLAQAAVRAKYPEPYYWAGFVMLD